MTAEDYARLAALPSTEVAALTAFLEARDQPVLGLVAVLFTIANRASRHHTSWTEEALRPMQYSCWNGGSSLRLGLMLAATFTAGQTLDRGDEIILRVCSFLAERIHRGEVADPIAGARHYCRSDLIPLPAWTQYPARVVRRIGDHTFYANVA